MRNRTFFEVLRRHILGGVILWMICAAWLIPMWYIAELDGAWLFQTMQP
jgi:hypothetical protein